MDFSFEAASLQARIIECVELHLVQVGWHVGSGIVLHHCTSYSPCSTLHFTLHINCTLHKPHAKPCTKPNSSKFSGNMKWGLYTLFHWNSFWKDCGAVHCIVLVLHCSGIWFQCNLGLCDPMHWIASEYIAVKRAVPFRALHCI